MNQIQSFATLALLIVGSGAAGLICAQLTDRLGSKIDREEDDRG